jgi:hypothetical protein
MAPLKRGARSTVYGVILEVLFAAAVNVVAELKQRAEDQCELIRNA